MSFYPCGSISGKSRPSPSSSTSCWATEAGARVWSSSSGDLLRCFLLFFSFFSRLWSFDLLWCFWCSLYPAVLPAGRNKVSRACSEMHTFKPNLQGGLSACLQCPTRTHEFGLVHISKMFINFGKLNILDALQLKLSSRSEMRKRCINPVWIFWPLWNWESKKILSRD